MKRNLLHVSLTLAAPILTRSGSAGKIGIDAPVARMRDGRCYLPFSLVKGRLRQSWDELGLAAADEWFGSRRGGWGASRGRFRFADFAERAGSNAETKMGRGLHRIRIDGKTGAALEGALQVIESPFGAGEHVVFDGDVTWFSNDDADDVAQMLEKAFRWTPSFGAGRTIGFGRMVDVRCKLESIPIEPVSGQLTTAGSGVRTMRITLRDPFCLARKRVDENLFASDSVIPGAVVRGVAATTLNRLLGRDSAAEIGPGVADGTPWAELADHFNEIRFTHSFPANADRPVRPTVQPLSIVRDANRKWWDVAACDGPGLIGGAAPEFAIDWKEHDASDLPEEFHWPEPQTQIRIRTAIDRKSKRAAEAQLFAYEMIEPQGLVWLGKADFSNIHEAARAAAVAQFERLFALEPAAFGKTKARGLIELTEETDTAAVPAKGLTFITLQTPALLCDPSTLDESSNRDALFVAYARAWRDLSDGHLRLVRFFASQMLAGGYLHHRFRSGRPYEPFLLTNAGSVFVVESDDEGAAMLGRWLRSGIPLPAWARRMYGTSWKENPFLPDDGYGEIAVNLGCHRQVPPNFKPVAEWKPPAIPDETSDRTVDSTAPQSAVVSHKEDLSAGKTAEWKFTNRWRIAGRLTTRSDFHLGSGATVTRKALTREKKDGGAEVEISAVAVDRNGCAYVPGSSLKGALRSWVADRAAADLVNAVFGDESDDRGQAGKAEFHDAFCSDAPRDFPEVPYWESERRTGVTACVALDRWTRSASDQKLFHREYVPPGISFDVVITGQDLGETEIALLLFALDGFGREGDDAVALGSETREGWGRFTWTGQSVRTFADRTAWTGDWETVPALNVAETEAILRTFSPDTPPQRLTIGIDVSFDGPFLVNEPSRTKRDRHADSELPNHAPRVNERGRAVLPVSSFRGALRSQAERIVRTLGGHACASTEPSQACSDIEKLCVTCRLFGAAGWASPLAFSEFSLTNDPQDYRQELLAVDRFTGGVSGSAKFNVNAVWKPAFHGAITIRDRARINHEALGVLALTLRDLAEGDIAIGFGASKGYGRCHANCSWPAATDPAALVNAFRTTQTAAEAVPLRAGAPLVVREAEQSASPAPAADEFHNPYAFVPVTRSRHGDLPVADLRTDKAAGVTHHRYVPECFSGRIICRLETETPLIVGSRQREGRNANDPKTIEPYRDPDTGQAAIPSTTLRGLISSVAETASNSAMRVLQDAALSYRCTERQNLPALGMIVGGGKQLRPLALPPLHHGEIPEPYRPMFASFAVPPVKAYVNGYKTTTVNGEEVAIAIDFIAARNPNSYSADHKEYWYMRLAQPVRQGSRVTAAQPHMAGPYLIAQRPEEGHPSPIDQDEFNALPPAEQKRWTRGILRVLGAVGRPPLARHKHEIFIPFPAGPAPSFDAAKAIDEFERLAEERTERTKEDERLPYEVKGSARNADPAKGANIKLRDGDIVFFEPTPDGRAVLRVAISSIWRRGVDGSVYDFFREVSPDLLPMNPSRDAITPAEQLFGYVEAESNDASEPRVRALAGRVRFSMARRDSSNAAASDFMAESTLQPLLSPKPPSPSFYFRPKNGTGSIAKRELTKTLHVPQGRKMYLHATADWRREGNGDRFSNRVTPVREGRVFWFHVDVDNLSASELGLLLYSLRPTAAFRHKLGMGKALGLGTVRIDPVAILRIDRTHRYGSQPLAGSRYAAAWHDASVASEQWPPDYAAEAEAVRTAAAMPDAVEEFRAAYRGGMDPDIRVPLELIGDPRKTVARVHTPQVESREIGVESYRWFMRNEDNGRQWLEPLDATSAALPLLSRQDNRVQRMKPGTAPQVKTAQARREPPPIPIAATWQRATLVIDKQTKPERVKAVAYGAGGKRLDAWALQGELPDYDAIVLRIKRRGELTADISVERMPDGHFRITGIEVR